MSRSGYTGDCDDNWQFIMWRGAVSRAIKGKRGQQFLREMLAALDALPERKLVAWELEKDGAVCAIGAVGKARGVDMSKLDPEDRETVAGAFGIAPALAAEIVFMNDEAGPYWKGPEPPEARFERMRKWIADQIIEPVVE
jgi:hypothetical protein